MFFAKPILCKVYSPPQQRDPALDHPIRAALLGLVRERGTLTSTEAARALGHSSGLCSFHLRQLARYGYLEEAEHGRGRVRPWRLPAGPVGAAGPVLAEEGEFSGLARDLEDEGYRRWLARKPAVAPPWQQDEAFSMVLHLSPAELAEAAQQIRAVLSRYERPPDTAEPDTAHPGTGRPVAAVVRLFPLLPAGG
jgi:hypothetical protein